MLQYRKTSDNAVIFTWVTASLTCTACSHSKYLFLGQCTLLAQAAERWFPLDLPLLIVQFVLLLHCHAPQILGWSEQCTCWNEQYIKHKNRKQWERSFVTMDDVSKVWIDLRLNTEMSAIWYWNVSAISNINTALNHSICLNTALSKYQTSKPILMISIQDGCSESSITLMTILGFTK